MRFLIYKIWTALRVRLTYWWWILKYRGKKNIPLEVVLGRMDETMKLLSENILKAVQASSANMSEDESKMVRDLLAKLRELEEGVADATKQDAHRQIL